MNEFILVTGGLGYIGQHVVRNLSACGYSVVIFDNLANSSYLSFDVLKEHCDSPLNLVCGDVRRSTDLDDLFANYKIGSVVHLAGLKVVNDSISMPLDYYDVNLIGSTQLIRAMDRWNVRRLVFSGSASVYGDPQTLPSGEADQPKPSSPYATSKLYVETILFDLVASDPTWSILCLRYFNPLGYAIPGGLKFLPKNRDDGLLTAIGRMFESREAVFSVYGVDYDTRDGSPVRDFIHIDDLAVAHVKGVNWVAKQGSGVCEVVNVGTGRGCTVLELGEALKKVSVKSVKINICERRVNDIPISFADVSKGEALLDWRARYDIWDICKSMADEHTRI